MVATGFIIIASSRLSNVARAAYRCSSPKSLRNLVLVLRTSNRRLLCRILYVEPSSAFGTVVEGVRSERRVLLSRTITSSATHPNLIVFVKDVLALLLWRCGKI